MLEGSGLTADEAESFHSDGYIVIPGVLSKHDCRRLSDRLESRLAEAKVAAPEGFYRYSYPGQSRLDRVFDFAEFLTLMDLPPVLNRVQELVGAGEWLRIIDHIGLRRDHAAPATKWHGAGRWPPLYHRREDRFACLLVKASFNLTALGPDSGGLRVAPGTHRTGVASQMTTPDSYVVVEAPRGSVTIFSDGVHHSVGANDSGASRYAIIIGYGPSILTHWPGFAPPAAPLAELSPRRERLLTGQPSWCDWPDDDHALFALAPPAGTEDSGEGE